jgi:death-on-curing protein
MAIEYPSAAEIHELHSRIVAGGSKTEPGIRKPEAVESALTYISEGYFDQTPKTIHEKAAHLMRLIVADHPYVDGNKRTALWAAFYLSALNGY